MDREKESPFVTHYQLGIVEKELRRDMKDGDDRIIDEMKKLDHRVDEVAVELAGIKVSMQNTEKNTGDLVALQREQNKHTRETNQRIFQRLDDQGKEIAGANKFIEDIVKSKEHKDENIKTIIKIGGIIGGLLTAVITFLTKIAPFIFH